MSTSSPMVTPPLAQPEAALSETWPGHWPGDILEAYRRYPGPYTAENVETLLDEEPVELYNGWLVWQEMTDAPERRIVATLQAMLDLSARKSGFGQVLPDQLECLLSDGSVVKPDASLISWTRLREHVRPYGPRPRYLLMGGPELVVEVRSPSNRRAQERLKRQLYFMNRVQIVWDVDPLRQQIWVYRATAPDTPAYYGPEAEITCRPLLPDWRRRMADIFAEQASAETVAGEVAQAWLAEGRAEGLVEGRAEGLVEGRAEGLVEGRAEGLLEGAARMLHQILPTLVRVRFGVVPPAELPARLLQCSLAELHTLQAAVETCTSLDAWLQILTDLRP